MTVGREPACLFAPSCDGTLLPAFTLIMAILCNLVDEKREYFSILIHRINYYVSHLLNHNVNSAKVKLISLCTQLLLQLCTI